MDENCPRGRHTIRRGSLVVTAFMLVLGMMVLVAGINTMLKEQMRQSLEIRSIAMAKLQALYLAEMGLNHIMFEANKAANVASNNPFLLTTTTGATTTLDFKNNVKMVATDAGGVANCLITRIGVSGSAVTFSSYATLTVTSVGTFHKTVNFSAQKTNGVWALANYTITP